MQQLRPAEQMSVSSDVQLPPFKIKTSLWLGLRLDYFSARGSDTPPDGQHQSGSSRFPGSLARDVAGLQQALLEESEGGDDSGGNLCIVRVDSAWARFISRNPGSA
jgi:hypothetical protein